MHYSFFHVLKISFQYRQLDLILQLHNVALYTDTVLIAEQEMYKNEGIYRYDQSDFLTLLAFFCLPVIETVNLRPHPSDHFILFVTFCQIVAVDFTFCTSTAETCWTFQ